MARITIEGASVRTHTEAVDVVNGIQSLTKIEQLSDVDTPNPLDNGNLLIWNGSSMNWENSNTVENDLTVTGNMIPYTLRANPDTNNAFTLYTTWENFGTDIYDLTTTLVTFKDPGSDILALHRWLTENGNGWYTYSAIDTGGGDDGSHITVLNLTGSEAEITTTGGEFRIYNNSGQMTVASGDASMALTDNANFNALNNFQVEQSENIFLNANSQFEVNSENIFLNANSQFQVNVGATANFNIGNNFAVYSGGNQLYMENGYGSNIRMTQQLEMVLRENYNNTSTAVNIIRHNSDGGGVVNDSTQVQYQFIVKSEDETINNIVGGMQASYNDGGVGNRFGFTLTDVSGTTEVNSVFMHETYTTTAQPFKFPTFNQTEINAMSPSNGWVLYNITTEKLQVYAAGSWVDLH